jgi:glycosyltransferase involved in cell wall biosynthesis
MGAARTLLVITHVAHYRHAGHVSAYAPYVLEMNVWAKLFERILIAAPLRAGAPPKDCGAFASRNVELRPVPETGGRGAGAKLRQLALLPAQVWRLIRLLRSCDAVHVRCPGNLGLLGVLLAPLFATKMIAKYAGQWGAYEGEPWSYRLQRRLLASRWWRGPVTVYSDGPEARGQVVPFFNSAMTAEQMSRARKAAAAPPPPGGPRRLLFVGRLSSAKGVDIAIECCRRLAADGLDVILDVVGEGPERASIKQLVARLELRDRVRLHGGRSFDDVLSFYEQAGVLLLPSATEGWPKVLAEAMAFGVPCVATENGLNPWILGEGRGLTAPARDAAAFAAAASRILTESPEQQWRRRQACAAWGQQRSLDDVERGLREIMERHMGLSFAGGLS